MKVAKMRTVKSFVAALILLLAASGVAMAQVSVWAEGAYTATDLTVYLYANTGSDALCSYGVKLSYDATKLNTPTATKNEDVWYFGTTAAKQPYMNPDTTTTPGQVVFIGGKLDTGAPTAGVTGTRVLLGKATFTRKDSNAPGSAPESYFGISTDLGKVSPFDNFVTTGGTVRDIGGVAFNSTNIVRARGDANGDGTIDIVDTRVVRQIFLGSSPWVVFADCDGDGIVDITDTRCIRNKFLNP